MEATVAASVDELRVVGIGASAGGLTAIQELFKSIPDDTGKAFVIIQHLSPDYKSLMPELLAKYTGMAINTATDKQKLEPNCVYLNQSRSNLHMKGDRLYELEKGPRSNLNLPIDIFFHTLGEELKENAIGVILSGTGSDGSRGIKTIKEQGGVVFVQTPESAQYDGMPNSAIRTELVDYVLSPQKIGEMISRYPVRKLHDMVPVDEDGPSLEVQFQDVINTMEEHSGIDFSSYKRTTLVRRLEKRINLINVHSLTEYLAVLRTDEAERGHLLSDFLIGVTSFFRDREAWSHLRTEVLPELVRQAPHGSTLRVWVPGCSTGEEAYSMAMVMDDVITSSGIPLGFKIYATDVNPRRIASAGAGVFGINTVDEIGPAYLEHYFIKKGDHIQIVKRIRDRIVFAVNDLLADPPFIRMDLVSCRNLLIYLGEEAQKKVISKLSFALRPNGYLFLGTSESVGPKNASLSVVNPKWKVFELVAPSKVGNQYAFKMDIAPHSGTPIPGRSYLAEASELPYYKFMSRTYGPALVVVDANFDIRFVTGDVGKRLDIPEGVFQRNIIQMVDGKLATMIRNGIRKAGTESGAVAIRNIRLGKDAVAFDMRVFKAQITGQDELYVIEFGPDRAVEEATIKMDSAQLSAMTDLRVEELEEELKQKNEDLRNLVEELETSNEELQASNEELMASNEELQSTNEELQSVNEELYTVNTEFQEQNLELQSVYTDLRNIYASQDIATLFLDQDLRIRMFTPKVQELLNLRESDQGRHLDTFMFFDVETRDQMMTGVRAAITEGSRFETPIREGRHDYLLRIAPFMNKDVIEGVIVTLVNIDVLAEAQAALVDETRFKDSITDSPIVGIYIFDVAAGVNRYANKGCQAILGLTPQEFKALSPQEFSSRIHPDDLDDVVRHQQGVVVNREQASLVYRFRHKNGDWIYCHSTDTPYEIAEDGSVASILGAFVDVTELQRKKGQLAEARTHAIQANKQKDIFLANFSHEIRTPISSILGFSNLLKRADLDEAERSVYAEQIESNSKQLMALVNDILDISKLEQGQLKIRYESVSLDNLLEEIVESQRGRLPDDGQVRLERTASDAANPPLTMVTDPVRLTQVVSNLLTNAIKFTSEGLIEVGYRASNGDSVAIWVRDEGIGIKESQLNLIFNRFSQADELLSMQKGGIGLGLSIAKSIVTLMGGTISVESVFGQGSTFTIVLPLDPPEPVPSEAPSANFGSENGPAGVKTLLIADDNESVQFYYRSLLKDQEIVLLQAFDGEEAVRMCRENPDIDLVLMDIRMPIMDGVEALREIRTFNSDVVIIAQSAFAMDDQIQRFSDAGFDGYYTKPMEEERLMALFS